MATGVKGLEKQALEPTGFFVVGNENGQRLLIYQRRTLMTGLRELAVKDTSSCQVVLLLGAHAASGKWVDVSAAVRVRIPDGEMSDAVWKKAYAKATEHYPELEVVGWGCSHPNQGLKMTETEKSVHRKYFGQPWHVFYVTDPVSNERCFYYSQSGMFAAAGGFRVYGKGEIEKGEPKMERESVKCQDEHVRDRYLEHGLDKVIKRLDSPTMRKIDWVMLGLLVLTFGVVLLRPQPTVQLDSKYLQTFNATAQTVNELNSRVTRLEEQLKAANVIDAEIKLSGEVTEAGMKGSANGSTVATANASGSTSAAGATKTTVAKTGRKVAGVEVGSKVSMHTIGEGDTIYSICEQYYGKATPEMCDALGKYNNLTPPDYELYLGEQIKVPEESVLAQ